MARVHADVNTHLGKSWYDYENFRIDWSPPDRYEIVRRMGGGKYSEVCCPAFIRSLKERT